MTAMSAVQRVDAILGLIRDGRECVVADLATRFRVSEMTVRRDLDALAAEGRVVRTHGGATAASGVSFALVLRAVVPLVATRCLGFAACRFTATFLAFATFALATAGRTRCA